MEKTKGHVLIVVESWQVGGTESYVASLSEWMKSASDCRVSVCVLGEAAGEALAPLRRTAGTMVVLDGRTTASKLWRFVAVLRQLKPSVCHLNLYSSLLPVAVAVKAASNARVVVTMHMPAWQWHWRHRLGWRIACRLADAVSGVSSAVLTSMNLDSQANNVALTPPPLPKWALHHGHPGRSSNGSLRVVGVGRLSAEKDWPTLVKACAALYEKGVECSLTLIGEGPLREPLEILAASLNYGSRTTFTGSLSAGELLSRLAEADAFVLPSRFEGFGMAALEAMAVGVPTITADFEASADYIEHGVTGHRFPRGDAPALAELLRWHRDNPAAARSIGLQGQASVRMRFAPATVFPPVLSAYGMQEPG